MGNFAVKRKCFKMSYQRQWQRMTESEMRHPHMYTVYSSHFRMVIVFFIFFLFSYLFWFRQKICNSHLRQTTIVVRTIHRALVSLDDAHKMCSGKRDSRARGHRWHSSMILNSNNARREKMLACYSHSILVARSSSNFHFNIK